MPPGSRPRRPPGMLAIFVAYTTAFWLRAVAWRFLLTTPIAVASLFGNLQASLLLNHAPAGQGGRGLPSDAGRSSRGVSGRGGHDDDGREAARSCVPRADRPRDPPAVARLGHVRSRGAGRHPRARDRRRAAARPAPGRPPVVARPDPTPRRGGARRVARDPDVARRPRDPDRGRELGPRGVRADGRGRPPGDRPLVAGGRGCHGVHDPVPGRARHAGRPGHLRGRHDLGAREPGDRGPGRARPGGADARDEVRLRLHGGSALCERRGRLPSAG